MAGDVDTLGTGRNSVEGEIGMDVRDVGQAANSETTPAIAEGYPLNVNAPNFLGRSGRRQPRHPATVDIQGLSRTKIPVHLDQPRVVAVTLLGLLDQPVVVTLDLLDKPVVVTLDLLDQPVVVTLGLLNQHRTLVVVILDLLILCKTAMDRSAIVPTRDRVLSKPSVMVEVVLVEGGMGMAQAMYLIL